MLRVSIDPGMEGTGLAMWQYVPNEFHKLELPAKVCVVQTKMKYNHWSEKCLNLTNQVITQIQVEARSRGMYITERVYIEFPHFRTDEVGYASTSKGDIYKLTTYIGMLTQAFNERSIPVEYVNVPDWKGTLSKEIVTGRIHALFSKSECERLGMKSHSYDAVGIGLYAKGGDNWYQDYKDELNAE